MAEDAGRHCRTSTTVTGLFWLETSDPVKPAEVSGQSFAITPVAAARRGRRAC